MTFQRSYAIALAAGFSTALTLSACSSGGETEVTETPTVPAVQGTGDTGETETSEETPEAAGVPEVYRAPLAAIPLAEETAGGTAFEIDEDDDGWDVHVAVDDREIEVQIDREGTEVRSTDRDDDLDSDDREALDAAGITLVQAIEIAIGELGGEPPLDDAEFTRESGTHAWEVSFEDDIEVYVDVTDGSVIRVES